MNSKNTKTALGNPNEIPAVKSDKIINELVKAAIKARETAYAPYSGFFVGAAVLTGEGHIYSGGNIENASYSVTNCAERTALFKAVSEGARHITAVAVAGGPAEQNGSLEFCPPCGVCRQALSEFGSGDLQVIFVKNENEYQVHQLKELLPFGFGAACLETGAADTGADGKE